MEKIKNQNEQNNENGFLADILPKKAWLSLKEACEAKGICYKTACNRTYLQPNNGKSDGNIGGRNKRWRRDTVLNWLLQTDEDLQNGGSYDS